MTIQFFQTDEGLDKKAVKGGIYHVELLNKRVDKTISLYVGESVWIVVRCAQHLFRLFKNPSYFGLISSDFKNDDLIIKFSVLQKIGIKNDIFNIKKIYKGVELFWIRKLNPETQLPINDRQDPKRVEKVQNKMIEYGFK